MSVTRSDDFVRGTSPCSRASAFTLIELLVVIAVIAILAGLLLPVLSKGKQQASLACCRNNNRQLMVALQFYASDNGDWIPPNPNDVTYGALVQGAMPGWVSGVCVGGCTNIAFLTDSKYADLAPYLRRQINVYKCPSDSGIWLGDIGDPTVRQGRLRSYSMNITVGANYAYSIGLNGVPDFYLLQGATPRSKFGNIRTPGPADLIVMVEEDEHTVITPAFGQSNEEGITDANNGVWGPFQCRAVASRHGHEATFGFADTHVESHRWINFPPYGNPPYDRQDYWPRWENYMSSYYVPNKTWQTADLYWLLNHLGAFAPPRDW